MRVACVVTLQKITKQIIVWTVFASVALLSPQQEQVRVFEGCVAASAFVNAFFDLVAPGPLLFVGALVDPLESLHSSGSCWLVLGLETGGGLWWSSSPCCRCCQG